MINLGAREWYTVSVSHPAVLLIAKFGNSIVDDTVKSVKNTNRCKTLFFFDNIYNENVHRSCKVLLALNVHGD